MNNKKRLGRGLELLYGDDLQKVINDIGNEELLKTKTEISVDDIIVNPYQPRKNFDKKKLNELASSIKEYGIIQPIAVRETIGNKFEIISGERRWHASKLANLKSIPSIVLVVKDDQVMKELAIIENIQREDLNPIEEARAFKAISDDTNMTQEELAFRMSKSRSYIANSLRLLKLPKEIQNYIEEKKISFGHAKLLLGLNDSKKLDELANRIVKEKLTVREVEKIISENYNKKTKIKSTPKTNYSYAEKIIREKIGTKVLISNKKIIINFNDDNHLNEILKILDLIDE